MPQEFESINNNINSIHGSETLLDLLLEWEDVLDNLDIYAFKNWKNFDQKLWEKIIEGEQNKIQYKDIELYGSDIIPQNIQLSEQSIEKLNLTKYIQFETKNFVDVIPSQNKGVLISNPPYGYRIGEMKKLRILYKQIGDHLKNHFQDFDSYIFTGNLELLKSIGLRTKKKIILKNGGLNDQGKWTIFNHKG